MRGEVAIEFGTASCIVGHKKLGRFSAGDYSRTTQWSFNIKGRKARIKSS